MVDRKVFHQPITYEGGKEMNTFSKPPSLGEMIAGWISLPMLFIALAMLVQYRNQHEGLPYEGILFHSYQDFYLVAAQFITINFIAACIAWYMFLRKSENVLIKKWRSSLWLMALCSIAPHIYFI